MGKRLIVREGDSYEQSGSSCTECESDLHEVNHVCVSVVKSQS